MLVFILLCVFNSYAQRDNSFKIVASMTGLGAAYEFNPAGILYTEAGLTTAFRASRISLQSKLAILNKENFKIKFGVEGAFIIGNVDVGGVYIDYDRFNNFVFMPMLSFESRVVGLQIPVFVDRSLTYIFPIVGITLNVTKDKPAKRIERVKSKKDFEKEIRKREKEKESEEEED